MQPRFGYVANPRNPSQRNLFEQEFIDQVFGRLRDELLLGALDELTTAGFALVILSPVMNETVFDDVFDSQLGQLGIGRQGLESSL